MRDFCVITIVFCVGIDVRMKNRDKGMEITAKTGFSICEHFIFPIQSFTVKHLLVRTKETTHKIERKVKINVQNGAGKTPTFSRASAL